MKKFGKILIMNLSIFFAAVSFAACADYTRVWEETADIPSEVSYGYTIEGTLSISKDNEIYYYQDMVREIISGKYESYEPYIKNQGTFGGYVYFLAFYRTDPQIDVGLFRVNKETIECEFVHDFKHVYQVGPYKAYQFARYVKIIDADRAVFQYNGTIQILDLRSKEISDSVEVYDKEEFAGSTKTFRYGFNRYGDYEKPVNNKLYYYQLDGFDFVLHEYDITDYSTIVRWKNYVYTYKLEYDNSTHKYETRYYECFDITDDSNVDLNILIAEIEDAQKQEEQEPEQTNKFSVIGGEKYCIKRYDKVIDISDENENPLLSLDLEYVSEHSETFESIEKEWVEIGGVNEFEINGVTVCEGKLFIGFRASFFYYMSTPAYLFEYDIAKDVFYYVGRYAAYGDLCTLSLHNK